MASRRRTGAISKSASARVAALVPTYNNARTLGDVVEGCLRHIDDLLVVDDGSTDATADVLSGFRDRVRVRRLSRNQGKGVALRTGFEVLRGTGFSHAVSVDADGQHFPEDLPRFVETIHGHPEALLVGERDMTAAGAPGRSVFGLWFSNFALRRLGGVRLRDSQAGFRAYPLDALSRLELRGTRYDLELEVLIKAARRDVALLPVPIRCTYAPGEGSVSHFRPVSDFLQIAGRMLKLLFSR